ncbi:phosphate ABC transporter ATP-binding protein [bacterium]|nr:MAG: phosphate ABC transporter ATP-binding protein [bacterium]
MHHRKVFELSGIGRKKRRSHYDDYKWILRNLDLDVFAGERLGLIGASGSGKTTLLRLLANLEPPDEGQILFDTKCIGNYNPSEYRRSIGFVQQTPSLFDGSVQDNLQFAPRLRNSELSDKELDALVYQVGLQKEILNAKSNSLSAGQAQRVAIARSLSVKPKALLMDEPTSALDPTAARRIVELVEKLAREMELTAIIVLHDLELARDSTDRIAFLANGKIDSCEKTSKFFENPPTELAERFIDGRSLG